MKFLINVRSVSALFAGLLAVSSFSACNRKRVERDGTSYAESQALTQNPFAPEVQPPATPSPMPSPSSSPAAPHPFVAEHHITGVAGDADTISSGASTVDTTDATYPRNEPFDPFPAGSVGGFDGSAVQRCDMNAYERELKDALEAAAADPDQKTVVVRYSLSFGTPFDDTAYLAYKRTVLRKDDDGITPIPVAPSDSLDGEDYAGSRAFHYYADHTDARKQYIKGDKCFFSTVKITGEEAGPITRVAGTWDHSVLSTPAGQRFYDHSLNILYYGDSYACSGDDCARRFLSPRLFWRNDRNTGNIRGLLDRFAHQNLRNQKLSEMLKECPGDQAAQVIPLYVADLREQRIGIPALDGVLISRTFSSSAVRRYEYEVNLKKILGLRALFLNRQPVQRALELPKTIGVYAFAPYQGVSQLIDNLIFSGLNGTVLSTQYTPIVIDLANGDSSAERAASRHIRTSSTQWGTFFNLANLFATAPNGTDKIDIHHLTAWLGGPLVDSSIDPLTGAALDANRKERIAEDGFLVLPEILKDAGGNALSCADGSPKYGAPRGESLFGSYARIDGQILEYNNGFSKLRSWVNASGTTFNKACGGLPAEVVAGARAPNMAEVKARYLGPWDTAAWDQLKVWVDRNRDGNVDCGEILSLDQARMAALNTCNLQFDVNEDGVLVPLKDKFGNQTHLRAAYLVSDSVARLPEAEVIQRVGTGKTSAQTAAEFRVAVDILFQARTDLYLEDVAANQIGN